MKRKQAFTLIEVLLGISIFSVVILCVYDSLRAGILLSQRSETNNTMARQVRLALNLITDEISGIVAYDFQNSYPDLQAFTGEKDKVTFLKPTGKGLFFVSYYLQRPQDGHIFETIMGKTSQKNMNVIASMTQTSTAKCLVREEQSFIDYVSGHSQAAAEIEVIATDIKEDGLRFSYGYFDADKSLTPTWKSIWTPKEIPSNVRIEIDFLAAQKDAAPLTVSKDILIPHGSRKK